jgi:ATP-dependent DNA helicase PIF1
MSTLSSKNEIDDPVVNKILYQVFNKKRHIYLSGPGGTGKSYIVTNFIKKEAEKREKVVAITSTTGVSALGVKGTTIHRWSGIKLGKESVLTIVTRIRNTNKDCLKRWKETDILVIDEISMLGLSTMEKIDRVGRHLREEPDLPFGGLQIIFSGDFLQLPAVNDDPCFKSDLWDELDFKYFLLKEPKRYPDKSHFEMLLRVRVGQHTSEDVKKLKERTKAYIDYIADGRERKDEIKPTRIYSINEHVNKHNNDELAKLIDEPTTYKAIDKFIVKNGKNNLPELKEKIDLKKKKNKTELSDKEIAEYTEFLDTVTPTNLFFKPGAQVMLKYNLSMELGLVNGSRGVVKSCDPTTVTVLFKNGITTKIATVETEFQDCYVQIIRHQIPLTLAWAGSIHGNQGSTLDFAIIDLGPSIFAAGQAYVSLSRVKTLDGILISSFVPKKIFADPDALEFEEMMEALESVDDKDEGNDVLCEMNKLKI